MVCLFFQLVSFAITGNQNQDLNLTFLNGKKLHYGFYYRTSPFLDIKALETDESHITIAQLLLYL